VEVTVAELLARDLADDRGLVDAAVGTYREYYRDVEIFTPPAA
jgi:hypothetical protein